MKVVTIIPCFNCEKYIRKTLDSVLLQNYKHINIIAIDDGSQDETRNILESYASGINILNHEENKNLGQAASINLGINGSDSELIAFIDADDMWNPNKINEQVKVFEEYQDVGLVYTNGHAIDEKDNIIYSLYASKYYENNMIGSILLDCYIPTPSSVMIRRELLKKTGLFRVDLQSMDHDMWIRMSEVTKFFYISQPLMYYRRHSNQLSMKRRQWEDGFKILRESCQRYPYSSKIRRKRLAVLFYRLGIHDVKNRKPLQGMVNLLVSGLLDPLRALKVITDIEKKY